MSLGGGVWGVGCGVRGVGCGVWDVGYGRPQASWELPCSWELLMNWRYQLSRKKKTKFNGFIDVLLNNGSSQGQKLALNVLSIPYSLDRSYGLGLEV